MHRLLCTTLIRWFDVKQTIETHTFANGLVLVAEPMQSLESAAFTFLVPSGCVFDPHDRSGLAALSCEMALRGAGERDSRRFIEDLENLGVQRGESVGAVHTGYSGATLAKNLPPTLAIYADMLRRAHLPAINWTRAGKSSSKNCGPSKTIRATR